MSTELDGSIGPLGFHHITERSGGPVHNAYVVSLLAT